MRSLISEAKCLNAQDGELLSEEIDKKDIQGQATCALLASNLCYVVFTLNVALLTLQPFSCIPMASACKAQKGYRQRSWRPDWEAA